jgi:hypothetical protein
MEDVMTLETDEPQTVIQIRFPQAILDRIDVWRRKQKLRPTRAQTIRFLVENSLGDLEQEEVKEPIPVRPRPELRRRTA